ncbi:hypothetical protein BKA69DRAFT_505599 [Paraphysoderma sedebokerense]|nr:hypothetical protein BKA69DRAFT_505599 [Paraphysoderma sedebokerense]
MFSILIFFWFFHIGVGLYPILVNIDIVSQASDVYCLPDFRRNDLLHRSYSIVLVTFIVCVLSIITVSYYGIWKKAVADGFRWNEKSFIIKNAELPNNCPEGVPAIQQDHGIKMKTSAHYSNKSSLSKNSLSPQNGTFNSEVAPSRDRTAQAKQIAMTKKLAIITFALYIAWIGSLCSFLYQMLTGEHVSHILDWFLGSFHFSHCIFNPLIILTMDTRWKIRFTFWRSQKPLNGRATS